MEQDLEIANISNLEFSRQLHTCKDCNRNSINEQCKECKRQQNDIPKRILITGSSILFGSLISLIFIPPAYVIFPGFIFSAIVMSINEIIYSRMDLNG